MCAFERSEKGMEFFMDCRLNLLITKNSARLDKLIESGAPYEKILKQSQKLDKYIAIAMKDINKIE